MTADYTIEATPGQVAAIERDGFLAVVGPTTKPCPECGGSGCSELTVADYEAAGIRIDLDDTDLGTPEYADDCPTCNGDGTVPITVEVVVPPRGHCPAGWAATTEDVCNCTGGHYCVRPRGHDSKQHRCACGVTTTRQDALPSPDEEGPARTILRGTAEAVPVVDDPDDVPGEPSVLSLTPMGRAIFWPEGESGPDGLIDITDHFAYVPRPKVGDTAWIIRGEG